MRLRLLTVIAALAGFGTLGLVRAAESTDVPTDAMGPHMEVTLRSAPAPGDRRRADAIVAAARAVMAQYPSVADAERAGFKKFLPHVALPIEHYTNGTYATEAWAGRFDPQHPTSLIFERHGDGLQIVGVMYTAPNRASQADLDADVPLSIGTWHRHVNFCVPPLGTPRSESIGPSARFYFGSIASSADCRSAGGFFVPRVFGWMVHVWPTASNPRDVWAVDREHSMENGATIHDSMMHDSTMHDSMQP